MAVQLGEVKAPEAVSAAVLGPESVVRTTDVLTRTLAKKLQGSTPETAMLDLSATKKDLAKRENILTVPDIQKRLQQVEPDQVISAKRDGVADKLNKLKSFTEKGIADPNVDSKAIKDAVTNHLTGHDVLGKHFGSMVKGDQDAYVDAMTKDPRYRRQVQERTKALVTDARFDQARTDVLQARDALDDATQRQQEVTDKKSASEQRRTLLKSERDKYEDPNDPKHAAYEQAKTEVNQDSEERKTEFRQGYQSLRQTEQQLAKARSDLRNSNLTEQQRKKLNEDETRLSRDLDTTTARLKKDYEHHWNYQKMNEERAELDQGIAASTADIQTYETQLNDPDKGLNKDVENKKQAVAVKEKDYDQVQDEFTQELDEIYTEAAKQYTEDRIEQYMKDYGKIKANFGSEAANKAYDDLYKKLTNRWFRGKRIGRGRTFDRLNIRKDIYEMLEKGPDSLFDTHSVPNDPEIRKKLTVSVGKDLMRLGGDTNILDAGMVDMFLLAPWAKDLRAEAENDPKFIESLTEYKKGKRDNKKWLYILLGAMAIAQTLQGEVQKEQHH